MFFIPDSLIKVTAGELSRYPPQYRTEQTAANSGPDGFHGTTCSGQVFIPSQMRHSIITNMSIVVRANVVQQTPAEYCLWRFVLSIHDQQQRRICDIYRQENVDGSIETGAGLTSDSGVVCYSIPSGSPLCYTWNSRQAYAVPAGHSVWLTIDVFWGRNPAPLPIGLMSIGPAFTAGVQATSIPQGDVVP